MSGEQKKVMKKISCIHPKMGEFEHFGESWLWVHMLSRVGPFF